MTLPRWLPGLLLLLVAAVTGWFVWQLQLGEEPLPLVGPPRSDYVLVDFELVSLDELGVREGHLHAVLTRARRLCG